MDNNAKEREKKRNSIRESIATSKEVTEYLGVTRGRLNQYVKTKRIEPIISGIYLKDDIEAFYKAFNQARENKKWLTEFK